MKEITELINPFSGDPTVITKVVNEAYMSRELLFNKILDENEFYALFSCGTLVKKGMSRTSTSGYLMGKKFKNLRSYYEKV